MSQANCFLTFSCKQLIIHRLQEVTCYNCDPFYNGLGARAALGPVLVTYTLKFGEVGEETAMIDKALGSLCSEDIP